MPNKADFLRQAWQSKGWLACLLWPTTLLSRVWLSLNQQAYRHGWRVVTHMPIPVLVVGNVHGVGQGIVGKVQRAVGKMGLQCAAVVLKPHNSGT